jgi:serine/threonine protein kinase
MQEESVIITIRKIAARLKYLHQYLIIHRDLKLENIMLRLKEEDYIKY